MIFELIQLVILCYSRWNKDIMRWKTIGHSRTQNISCSTRYFIVQELSNKQSAKVIYRFDRCRTAYSKRQNIIWALKRLSFAYVFNYILLRVNPGLTICEDLATALYIYIYIYIYIIYYYTYFTAKYWGSGCNPCQQPKNYIW